MGFVIIKGFDKIYRLVSTLVLFGWHNMPPLVEIGLTDLSKYGGAVAMVPPAPTGLNSMKKHMYMYMKRFSNVI